MKRRQRRRPNGRTIWLAKDQSGVYAYNHKPRLSPKEECSECGSEMRNFAGTPEKDCWEFCDDGLKSLGIRPFKHGEVRRYVLAPEESDA